VEREWELPDFPQHDAQGEKIVKSIALYQRVSTADQSTDAQRIELIEYVGRRWPTLPAENIREFTDTASGAKFSRIGLDLLMAEVRKGRVDAVVCVKIDRLGRSLPHLAQLVIEFQKHNVALICPRQAIDTSADSPCGQFQLAILMAVAQFERDMIIERTRAGLVAAKARGSTLGRPRFVMTDHRKLLVNQWLNAPAEHRMTLQELAGELGCSIGKAHALVQEAR
jgi:DNA invertase Pin-like site-specific DNA recombinase